MSDSVRSVRFLTRTLRLETAGDAEMLDVTGSIQGLVDESGMREGNVTVFVGGSTAAVTTIEFEPGLRRDLPELLDRLIPATARYHHDDTWHDGNGHAHLRASMIGPSLIVPFLDARLLLGTWQQIVVIDFDNRARRRDLVVQLLGA